MLQPAEVAIQVGGYVFDEEGQRIDKFTLTSPVFFEVDRAREWLDDLPNILDTKADEQRSQ